MDYIFKAKTQWSRLNQASKLMNLNPEEIVVIGDQMLTDVFGNRHIIHNYGCPSEKTDGFITKFNRMIERRLLQCRKRLY